MRGTPPRSRRTPAPFAPARPIGAPRAPAGAAARLQTPHCDAPRCRSRPSWQPAPSGFGGAGAVGKTTAVPLTTRSMQVGS
jgi:hypothetical protein